MNRYMFNILFLVSISVLVYSCQVVHNNKIDVEYKFKNAILYDTLESDFLYEYNLPSYNEVDVVLKRGQYIISNEDVSKSYDLGYFILDPNILKKSKEKAKELVYDSLSIYSFYSEQYTRTILYDSITYSKLIKQYCNLSYLKFHMKLVAINMGKRKQLIPIFKNCGDIPKRNKKAWKKIPTYLITNILFVEQL